MIGTHLTNTVSHIFASLGQITGGSMLNKIVVASTVAIASFLAPIKWLLLICFATTIVDMICGIRVARTFKQKIESGKNWKGTLHKIMDEFTIIALAHGIEWAILGQAGVFILTGGATAIITLTEMWSIIENLNTVDPKGPWRILGKFLKKKGEDYVGMKLDFDKNYDCDNKAAKRPNKNRK